MKKRTTFCLLLTVMLMLASFTSVFADTTVTKEPQIVEITQVDETTIIELLDDGSYFETVIEEEVPLITTFATTKSKSGTKTVKYQNGKGTTLWYVKVHGAFKYNGSTSSCTSSTVSASAPASNWFIKSKSASKSGNTARATATAIKKTNGAVTSTITRNVGLTCSKSGKLS